MTDRIFSAIPGLDHEEYLLLKEVTRELRDDQLTTFLSIYNGKRVKSEMILIGGLIGLLGIAGVQRFMVNQIGMGILFLLTAGLCFVGTIVDLVNYKKLTLEFNQEKAYESLNITKSVTP